MYNYNCLKDIIASTSYVFFRFILNANQIHQICTHIWCFLVPSAEVRVPCVCVFECMCLSDRQVFLVLSVDLLVKLLVQLNTIFSSSA